MTIHKFYQTDANGKVTTAHHVDEKNIINELRKILNNVADTFGQTKFGDGLYPKDDTDGLEFDINRTTVKTGTGTLTIAECGFIKLTAGAPYTLYLPTAVGNEGRYFVFFKSDDNANLITIDAHEAETIDGQLTYIGLNYQYACVIFRSDNIQWTVVGRTIKNVTDDAQLKREAGDINTFGEKSSLQDDDVILIEDSASSYVKKKAKISSLSVGTGLLDKVLVFNYDNNEDIMPESNPGPMDFYFDEDGNGDLQPIAIIKTPSAVNFLFEIDTNGDIMPR